jgi:hypothetical protein
MDPNAPSVAVDTAVRDIVKVSGGAHSAAERTLQTEVAHYSSASKPARVCRMPLISHAGGPLRVHHIR